MRRTATQYMLLAFSLFVMTAFSTCHSNSRKSLNMNRVKRIEFTSSGPEAEGCADPADPAKRLPLGTKYCLNPTGDPGDGYLYVCQADGSWNRTEEKCP
jgi:hypothetical protein